MDLNDTLVFVRVAQAGGFSAAARLLGMPTSTLSVRVSRLEKRLGVTLLQRTTRRLRLTEAGQAYLRQAARWPATFYGQIALRQLGEEPTIENMGPRPYEAEPRLRRAAYVPQSAAVEPTALEAFVQADARCVRR